MFITSFLLLILSFIFEYLNTYEKNKSYGELTKRISLQAEGASNEITHLFESTKQSTLKIKEKITH